MSVRPKLCYLWCQCGNVFYNFTRKNIRFCVLAFNIYAITFAIALPVICNDWAYSHYYFRGWSRSTMEKRAVDLNTYHAAEAREYIDKLTTNESLLIGTQLSQSDVDLAIGIVTVPRSRPPYRLDYLTQTFVALHRSISQEPVNLERKVVFMCNTFPGPGNHSELQRFTSLVTIYNRYTKDNVSASRLNSFEKEKEDYVYCMNVALTYEPKYVLIIEDDTLAVNNLLEILHYILLSSVENKFSGGDLSHNVEEWAYLKLFYPNRWKGYAFETIRVLELVSIGLVGGSISVLVGCKCTRKESTPSTLLAFFIVGSVYFILAAFMIGRPYLIEWRRISKYTYTVVSAPDCCSPAILYAADKARKLANFLKTVKCNANFPIDYAMDEFAKRNNYKKYLIEPNVFHHIGMFSSIKSKSRHPEQFIYR